MQSGLYQNIFSPGNFYPKSYSVYLMQKTFNLHMFELWIPPHGKQFYSRLCFNEESLKLGASLELCICHTCFLDECSNHQQLFFPLQELLTAQIWTEPTCVFHWRNRVTTICWIVLQLVACLWCDILSIFFLMVEFHSLLHSEICVNHKII